MEQIVWAQMPLSCGPSVGRWVMKQIFWVQTPLPRGPYVRRPVLENQVNIALGTPIHNGQV